ncbi:hypothetical protein [Actinoplanes sp. NPDC049599]
MAAGRAEAVPLHRRLRAVWPAAGQLIGPARDLYTIARRRRPQ